MFYPKSPQRRIYFLTFLFIGVCQASQPDLVELRTIIPDIILDIRYATPNNFTGEVLYPSADCFLIRKAALALKRVQEDLKKQGYRLKVFDGYRPLAVQWKMWKVCPNPKYVADPRKGSRHNRGYAVDLTLVDLAGNDVLMPTEFDDLSERAHRNNQNLPPEAIKHRQILEKAMIKHGFIPMKTEWWHFDFKGYQNKPNLDIPFDSLKNKKAEK